MITFSIPTALEDLQQTLTLDSWGEIENFPGYVEEMTSLVMGESLEGNPYQALIARNGSWFYFGTTYDRKYWMVFPIGAVGDSSETLSQNLFEINNPGFDFD